MTRFLTRLTPLQKLLLGYLFLLLLGCGVLNLEVCGSGDSTFIDHCFTAASALTTTGLTTLNVADTYKLLGEIVILLLMQVGGLGYMSLAGWLLLESNYGLKSREDAEEEEMVENDYTVPEGSDHRSFVIKLLWFTLICEAIGSIVLSLAFAAAGESTPVWKGIFTAVSAFCTAGFHLFDNSLHEFTENVPVNLAVMTLSLAGSFGFLFFVDVYDRLRGATNRLGISTRAISLVMAVSLVGVTATLMFYDPYFHTGGQENLGLLAGAFQAVSAVSTTGFSTVPIDRLSPASALLLTIFMFIGASPSGTGGGIKNTTAATAVAYVVAVVRRKRDVVLLGAKLPRRRIHLAVALLIANLVLVMFGGFVLLVRTPDASFAPIFEVVSALGTVGLSLGTTDTVDAGGKVLLMVLMMLGRLGTLSVIMALLGYSPNTREERDDGDGQSQDSDIAIEG
ncbi:TrkH family potassium uptake protein [Lewinella sp. IMCC34191]|uniref:TrkH family potassium uptake protein n=1 Tax=Lewinella sp. IMCC34191 TaxID=2259172 RepID=UPI000E2233A0|nr:potassium transporter TrkG [Lewinella sp. IMCC34191]